MWALLNSDEDTIVEIISNPKPQNPKTPKPLGSEIMFFYSLIQLR